MITLGLALILLSAVQAIRVKLRLDGFERADGTIVRADAHPVITFETKDGQRRTFVQNGFLTGAQGQHVVVLYDQARPEQTAVVDAILPAWWTVIWVLVPGLALLILALGGARLMLNFGRYG
jgi:hypothetical protein